jgi:AGZA family xanthine/uracil permease-like MFS transporter
MPLTFNVATGFGLGFISYIVLSLITGKAHRLDLVGMLIAVAFAVNFCMR